MFSLESLKLRTTGSAKKLNFLEQSFKLFVKKLGIFLDKIFSTHSNLGFIMGLILGLEYLIQNFVFNC